MLLALIYFVLRRLVGLAGSSSSSDLSKDVEILVLRHQFKVLRPQVGLKGCSYCSLTPSRR